MKDHDQLARLEHERVLVTGAHGSVGVAVVAALEAAGVDHLATDISTMDVRNLHEVQERALYFRPTVVLHLAGAKHAPGGELEPYGVLRTNAVGTENVLSACRNAHVVLASTCKAADPETVYGASKLIAERMVLKAGGNVARFFNVVETAGNVFEIWRRLPADAPLPVAPCERFFIHLDQAVGLLLWAAVLPGGCRYTVGGVERRSMWSVAQEVWPGREVVAMAPRPGDRLVEPECARAEWLEPSVQPGIVTVRCAHDLERELIAA